MGHKLKVLFSVFCLLTVLVTATPVKASPEDAAISIQSIHAYQSLAEDGDMTVVFHWRWTSDNYSETAASRTVIIQLVADNGTVVSTTTLYVFTLFDTDGYQNNVSSFYLTPGVAEWEGDYTVEIKGLPAYYSPPPVFEYPMSLSDYSTAADQEEARAELNTYILDLCSIFKTFYPDVLLKTESDMGIVLSSYGESFFTSVIPGLQTLCPTLFFVQVYVPEVMPVEDYDMSLQTQYTGRLEGTDLMRGADRLGDVIGVSAAFIWGIFMFIGMLAFGVFCSKKGWGIEVPLLVDGGAVVGFSMLFGDLFFTLAMILGLVSVMGIMYVITFKRA